MNKVGLNEKIRNQIGRNLYYMSCVVTNNNVRKEFEKNNELLNEIVVEMRQDKSSEDYEKGLNDAWKLAQKIVSLSPQEGGYSCYDMRDIFGSDSLRGISNEFTVQEALAKSQEYEKKKAEEAAKLVPGDVVEIKNMSYGDRKAIFIKYEDDDAVVIFRKGGSARLVGKDVWTIVKTGKHVDISELIEVLYD